VTATTPQAGSTRLRINPVACNGIGMCAHLAPGLIRVDSWGYPVLADHPLREAHVHPATAAISACPRAALFIETVGGS
jgi:ferredoxin